MLRISVNPNQSREHRGKCDLPLQSIITEERTVGAGRRARPVLSLLFGGEIFFAQNPITLHEPLIILMEKV